MKIVSPKKSGRKYLRFTVISIVLLVFFFTSKLWTNIGYKSASENYDVILKQNDYNIKITDASYHDGICEFTMKCKLMKDSTTQSYPAVTKITFDSLTDEYEFVCGEMIDDYSTPVTVPKPPQEFKVMKIVVSSKLDDVTYDDSYNEFGELVPGYTEEGEAFETLIKIDISDMAKEKIQASPGHKDDSFTDEFETLTETQAPQTEPVYVQRTEPEQSSATPIAADSTAAQTSISSDKTTKVKTESASDYHDNQDNNVAYPSDDQPVYLPNDPSPAPASTQPQPVQTQPPATDAPPAQTTGKPTETTRQTTTRTTTTPTTTTKITVVHADTIRIESDFENNNITLNINEKTQLKAVVLPENAVDRSVTWTSNKSEICEVDSTGRVTAKAKGKAIITAKTADGGLSASCMVTVN